MSDKAISETEWKKFSKGRSYKDAALVKALAAAEDTQDKPTERLQALSELGKQADALRRAHKADKELGAYLDDIDKALPRLRKAAEVAAAAEAAAAEAEDVSPALLTTKMVPLLRQVRGGEVMEVMLGHTSKQLVVLMMRRTPSASQRKLLIEYADDASGMKFMRGVCIFEANAHTFVFEARVANLAKRIKAALLAQTGQRVKVRVRGESLNDVEEDLDDEDPSDATAAAAARQERQQALKSRLVGLQARIQAALTSPAAAELKTLVAGCAQALQAMELDAATERLASIEDLLTAPSPAPSTPSTSSAAAAAATGIRPGTVDYARCRLAWEAARKKVHAELQALEATILERYRDTRGFADLTTRIRKFDTVLTGFEDKLSDLLDDALNAQDDTQRAAHHAAARASVKKFLERARGDRFITNLQNNPFMPVTVQTSLVTTLEALDKRLS